MDDLFWTLTTEVMTVMPRNVISDQILPDRKLMTFTVTVKRIHFLTLLKKISDAHYKNILNLDNSNISRKYTIKIF